MHVKPRFDYWWTAVLWTIYTVYTVYTHTQLFFFQLSIKFRSKESPFMSFPGLHSGLNTSTAVQSKLPRSEAGNLRVYELMRTPWVFDHFCLWVGTHNDCECGESSAQHLEEAEEDWEELWVKPSVLWHLHLLQGRGGLLFHGFSHAITCMLWW